MYIFIYLFFCYIVYFILVIVRKSQFTIFPIYLKSRVLNKISEGTILFQFHNFQFLLKAANSINYIVKTCLKSTRYNFNTYIGYKLALYHYKYYLGMHNTCTNSVTPP